MTSKTDRCARCAAHYHKHLCRWRDMKNGCCDREMLVLVLLWIIIIKRINNKDHVTATTTDDKCKSMVLEWLDKDGQYVKCFPFGQFPKSSLSIRSRSISGKQINCLSIVTSSEASAITKEFCVAMQPNLIKAQFGAEWSFMLPQTPWMVNKHDRLASERWMAQNQYPIEGELN